MRLFASRSSRLAALVLLALPGWSPTLPAAEQRVADPRDLPAFPPVTAWDALNTVQLRKEFRLELVAAEPLVTDPIALAFDADGRLFVIGMNDYPDRKQHRGKVTKEGDSYTGLIINETAGSITIRQPLGAEVAVARVQIARMQASQLSLMPEGLEEGLSNQDLADLADFIMADSRPDQTP